MALDEFLFAKVTNYIKRAKERSSKGVSCVVQLEKVKERLTILARAVTGHAIDIFPAEREGGYKNNAFFLPASIALFPSPADNERLYIFRILYLAAQKKLNLNWSVDADASALQLSQERARETSGAVLHELFEEFPIAQEWHNEFVAFLSNQITTNTQLDTIWLYGKWMVNSPEAPSDKTLKNISDQSKVARENKVNTTLQARAVEEVVSVEVDKKQQEDYVLTHNFEKVETAEEFDGVWRDFDGEDELKDHEEAVNELSMKYTVRTDDAAHSVYQAEFIENTTISESAETAAKDYHVQYPEWDYAKKSYKKNFCKVFPKTVLKTDAAYYRDAIQKNAVTLMGLRKMLTSVNNRMQQQRKQVQGNEFDIDALTDLFVDVHTQHTPSENIYISNRKIEKDLSILLLLDVSLSADGYANGNRVIDVEKEVSILFGEILNEFNVDFSIHSFYSKTRNHSTYQTLKDFDAGWNRCRNVIGSVEPIGYTRIGAALRHSGALLDKRPSKNKWVILLSDGKPNDYDKYEGRYGIQDVKQALRELHERDIKSYALAIEAQAKYYLPQMFGQNHYQVLTTPVELLKSLVKLFDKIKYQA